MQDFEVEDATNQQRNIEENSEVIYFIPQFYLVLY